jgi:hypothetical protein
VFVYGRAADKRQTAVPVHAGPDFIALHPFYIRAEVTCVIEDIPIHLTTIHGASGFDNPGGAVLAAAKLARRLGQFPLDNGAPLLVHEPGQGFFPCWLLALLRGADMPPVVLSGRNILALEATRYNVTQNVRQNVLQNAIHEAVVVPAVDLRLGETALREAAGGRPYGCIAAFPELLPQSSLPKGADQLAAIWDAVPPLLAGGGVFLITFSSSDAERFDRKKPAGFTRLGSVKRNGFRALAYRFMLT